MRPAHVQALSCMPQPPLPTAHRCHTMTARAVQIIETPKVFTSSVDSYTGEARNRRVPLGDATASLSNSSQERGRQWT
jgi:hypothetical protein